MPATKTESKSRERKKQRQYSKGIKSIKRNIYGLKKRLYFESWNRKKINQNAEVQDTFTQKSTITDLDYVEQARYQTKTRCFPQMICIMKKKRVFHLFLSFGFSFFPPIDIYYICLVYFCGSSASHVYLRCDAMNVMFFTMVGQVRFGVCRFIVIETNYHGSVLFSRLYFYIDGIVWLSSFLVWWPSIFQSHFISHVIQSRVI